MPRSRTELDGAYLRRILADTGIVQSDGETLLDALRNFTSVERLEGDNMIGCRRCWKMKHGLDADASSSGSDSDDEDSSSEDEAGGMAEFGAGTVRRPTIPLRGNSIHYKASASVTSLPSLRVSGVPDESETSESELDVPERGGTLSRSVPSLPPRPSIVRSASAVDVPSVPNTYVGPVPTIETTAPEAEPASSSGSSTSLHRRERATGGREPSSAGNSIIEGLPDASQTSLSLDTTLSSPASSSTTSLSWLSQSTPPSQSTTSLSRGAISLSFSSPIPSSPRSPSPVAAPEASSSAAPPVRSPVLSPSPLPAPVEKNTPAPPAPSSPRPKPAKSGTIILPDGTRLPRSKQIIPRPTLKRYLVARPPRVLVLHLKRFQQVQNQPFFSSPFRKSPAPSGQFGASYDIWSGGLGGGGNARFRKVDEWIEFPERLDLAPFVAPARDGLVAGDVEKTKSPTAHVPYRLYAVVVHIGNMLGGHYIAYTALPGAVDEKAKAPVERHSDDFVLVDNEAVPVSSSKSEARQWCHISDTHVRLCTLEEVLAAKAYICFYERVE